MIFSRNTPFWSETLEMNYGLFWHQQFWFHSYMLRKKHQPWLNLTMREIGAIEQWGTTVRGLCIYRWKSTRTGWLKPFRNMNLYTTYYWLSLRHHTTTVVYDSPSLSIWPLLFVVNRFLWLPADSSQMTSSSWTLAWTSISGMARAAARMNVSRSDVTREFSTV